MPVGLCQTPKRLCNLRCRPLILLAMSWIKVEHLGNYACNFLYSLINLETLLAIQVLTCLKSAGTKVEHTEYQNNMVHLTL